MAAFQGSILPVTAVNWIDILANGEFADAAEGHLLVISDVTSRIAVGVADPVASTSAGVVLTAGEAVEVILGSEAAAQTLWVQTLASADAAAVLANTPTIKVNETGGRTVIVAIA